jgi:arsenate reductase
MAEGFVRALASGRFEVASAGTEATSVHPPAIHAMDEVGIDLRGHGLAFPGSARRVYWSVEGPSAASGEECERLGAPRRVRDQIGEHPCAWLAATPEGAV